ncbi:MAG TPA: MATE family efflux transporter, partial [Vicingus sp.]|nr:MATE family efflux transporter [Vicingus sp.]
KDITGLGSRFFVVQTAAMVMFTTDSFIISQLFSPREVVPYNVAFKYFSIATMAYTILITPFWSSFTEAYAKKDFDWIKKTVTNIQKIWLLVLLALIVMVVSANWFYKIWVGGTVQVPILLTITMAVFVAMTTYNMVYVNFINGVGKIKIQLITSIISMLINIPISIVFAKYFNWGITGVMLATCFCMSYGVVLRPVQYFMIINNRAKGIWNK